MKHKSTISGQWVETLWGLLQGVEMLYVRGRTRDLPRLRGGQSGAPAARAGSPPWCSGVRDVEDVEEEEALAQQGAALPLATRMET